MAALQKHSSNRHSYLEEMRRFSQSLVFLGQKLAPLKQFAKLSMLNSVKFGANKETEHAQFIQFIKDNRF